VFVFCVINAAAVVHNWLLSVLSCVSFRPYQHYAHVFALENESGRRAV